MAEEIKTQVEPGEYLTDYAMAKWGVDCRVWMLRRIIGAYHKYQNIKDSSGKPNPPIAVWFPYQDPESPVKFADITIKKAVKDLVDSGTIYTHIERKSVNNVWVNQVHFQLLDPILIKAHKLTWLTGVPEEKKDKRGYYRNITDYLLYDFAVGYQLKDRLADASYAFIWLTSQLMCKEYEHSSGVTAEDFGAINNWFKTNYEFKGKPKYNYAWLFKAIPDITKERLANRDKVKQPTLLSMLKTWHKTNQYEVPFYTFPQAYEHYTGRPFKIPVITSLDDYVDAKRIV